MPKQRQDRSHVRRITVDVTEMAFRNLLEEQACRMAGRIGYVSYSVIVTDALENLSVVRQPPRRARVMLDNARAAV